MTVHELIHELERLSAEDPKGKTLPVYVTTHGSRVFGGAIEVSFEDPGPDGEPAIIIDTIVD